jgi:PilZ domain
MTRRSKERITVKFDCVLAIGEERKRCTIQNISRCGVLTLWPTDEFLNVAFRLGDRFPLEIRFCDHRQFGSKGLSCVGTVVRVALDQRQVAFRISRAKLGALGLSTFASNDSRSQFVM